MDKLHHHLVIQHGINPHLDMVDGMNIKMRDGTGLERKIMSRMPMLAHSKMKRIGSKIYMIESRFSIIKWICYSMIFLASRTTKKRRIQN